jgi:RNA polymerase sigma-70 factor (ECF subfamily)
MTYSSVTLESLLLHQTWALRVARRLVREENEAEDLVQRTWLAALRSPPQSQVGAKAWIRKVILNLARERHRRNQVRHAHETSRARPVEPTVDDASESVSRSEIHRLLSERLMQLAEPYRTVVLQRFYEDLTSVEIAQRLGIPPGTVRWRLKMGLDQLRAELDKSSEGDRTRWVSALLAFVSPPHPASASTSRPLVDGHPAAVTVLAGVTVGIGLFGYFLLRDEPERSRVERPSGISRALEASSSLPRTEPPPESSGRSAFPPATSRSGDVATRAPEGLPLLVLDPAGKAVQDASIYVARVDGQALRTRTDAEGRAWLVPEPGDVGGLGLLATQERLAVRALAPGLAASDLVHVAPPFERERALEIFVGGPEVVLRGVVRTSEGAPLPGALVASFVQRGPLQLRPDGDLTTTSYVAVRSGSDGTFELAGLSQRDEVVACFLPGFALYARQVATLDSDRLEIVLERGATISGTIRNPDGSPAVDVPVALESICKTREWATGLPGLDARTQGFAERARTDSSGRFRLTGVGAGGRERTLWATDEEHGWSATTTLHLENGDDVSWNPDLAARPCLDLTMVDENGRPLVGLLADVRRSTENSWWARRIHTDSAGRVRILDCPDGAVYVDLFPVLGVPPSLGWRVIEPAQEPQTLVFDSRRLATLTGRVRNSAGAPQEDGDLIALSLDTSLETSVPRSPDGRFAVRLPPGLYLFILRSGQTAGKLAEARVRAGRSQDLGDLFVPVGGRLLIEVLPSPSEPATYSLFRLPDEEGIPGSLLVGQGWLNGSVELGMFPGRYRVLVFAGGGPARSHVVRVVEGLETRLAAR